MRPFPWLPFSVKLLSETFAPRGGTGGPGSEGLAASGPPLWMPSLFEPDLIKKPVRSRAGDAPIAASRHVQPRDQGASVNNERDRVACGCGGHCRIDSRSIIGGRAACGFVASVFQVTVERAANLRCPDIRHSRDRHRRRGRAQTGDIKFASVTAADEGRTKRRARRQYAGL